MRPKILLAGLLALLASPALADTTATYDADKMPFTAAVADDGNSRIGVEGQFELIRRDGVDYIVLTDRAGAPHVARADAAFAAFVARKGAPPENGNWLATPGAQANVAGYSGTLWQFGPEKDSPLELLMSADPALAPVGPVFARYAEAVAEGITVKSPGNASAVAGVRAVFANGTPIRVRDLRRPGSTPTREARTVLELRSVSKAPIDPHRFDLPGPVLPPDAFFAAIRPPSPANDDVPIQVENAEPESVRMPPAPAPRPK